MKLRIAAILVISASLGIAAWALYQKHVADNFMLSMLYLDTTTQVREDLYLLARLREGKTPVAITHLERLLENNVTILEGCKFDLCASSTPALYADALQAAAAYRKQYQAK